jgi:3-oxoacyl-[acyl-carrier protein] reductase
LDFSSLIGRRVLITGGGRGIGAHAADFLAQLKCKLVLCARTEQEVLTTAEKISKDHGVPVLPLTYDVSDPGAVETMAIAAVNWAGGLEVLVNNAGVPGPMGALEKTPLDEWRKTLEINLFGMVHCARAVLPGMKQQGFGKIINICGGGVGWRELPENRSAYVASKFAVYGFTEALACELKNHNIQVNALSPGPVATRPFDEFISAEKKQAIKDAGNDMSPDPAARMLAFLASDQSGDLSGKMLSARWDDADDLAADIDALNDSCRKTLRKIDDTNYTEVT